MASITINADGTVTYKGSLTRRQLAILLWKNETLHLSLFEEIEAQVVGGVVVELLAEAKWEYETRSHLGEAGVDGSLVFLPAQIIDWWLAHPDYLSAMGKKLKKHEEAVGALAVAEDTVNSD